MPQSRRYSDPSKCRASTPGPRPESPDPAAPPIPDREDMWPGRAEPLSAGERAVLQLLAQRLSSQEIAASLGVAWQTVALRIRNVYRRLGVTRRQEAVERARALGLL